MGGDSNKQEVTTRYAPYLEDYHKMHLNGLWNDMVTSQGNNPYIGYADIQIEDAFFGAGYVISSFPSLYDMYGKFMAGLDVEVLFDESYEDTINGPVVNETIDQEASRLEDDLIQDAYPRLETGMRDINSVMSSSFIIGRTMLEANRQKALARFAAEARYRLLPVVTDRWKSHLSWNGSVIEMYAQIMKLYVSAKLDTDDRNYEMAAKSALWPFNAAQHMTAVLNALSGATDTETEVAGSSKAQKTIGGAMSGAAAGAMVGSQFGSAGGPIGMGIGAGIGALIGWLS